MLRNIYSKLPREFCLSVALWPCVRQSTRYHTHNRSVICVLTHHHTTTSQRIHAQYTCLSAKCGGTAALDQRKWRGRPPLPSSTAPTFSLNLLSHKPCLPQKFGVHKLTVLERIVSPLWMHLSSKKIMIKKNTNLTLILGTQVQHSMRESAFHVRDAWSWDVNNYDKVNQRSLLSLPKTFLGPEWTTLFKTNYLFWIKGVRLSRVSPLKQGQIQFAVTPLSNNISNCCHFHLRQ